MRKRFGLLFVLLLLLVVMFGCNQSKNMTAEISCDDITMKVGDSIELNITCNIENPVYKYILTGESVELKDGVITAVKPGRTYIFITVEGYSGDKNVDIIVEDTGKPVDEREDVVVKFDADNGTEIISNTIKVGDKVSKPTDPEKVGYTFDCWTLNNDKFDFTDEIQYNITLVAKYKINQYTLTFKKNNGENDLVVKYEYNEEIQSIDNPKKEYYSFAGWDIEIPTTMPDENLVANAVWTPNKYTLTIKFNDNRSSNLVLTQEYNTPIQTITVGSRKGYTFDGWTETIPATMPGENKIIEAIWKPCLTTLTIKDYYSDGSEFTITQEYDSDLVVTDPTKNGYNFAGYYTGVEGTGFPVVISKMFITDMTIYPKWEIAKRNISYQLNGGTTTELPKQFDINSPEFVLPTPEKEGFVFDGWYTDYKYTNRIYTLTNLINEDLTIYAKWNAKIDKPSLINSKFTYNGKAQKPLFDSLKEEQIDISGDYEGIYNVGNYTAFLTPSENYCWDDGTKTPYSIIWEITKLEVPVIWDNTTVEYNGIEQTPLFYISVALIKLSCKKAYTNVGKYTAELEYTFINDLAANNYNVTNTTCSFEITPAKISSVELDQVEFSYTGSTITPNITSVKSGLMELTSDDYTYVIDEAVEAGQYKAIVNGTGNFNGTIETIFTVKKVLSGFGFAVKTIYAHPYDDIDLSDYTINNYGTVNYEVNTYTTVTQGSFVGNNYSVGPMSANDDDNATVVIKATDSGDLSHESTFDTLTIIVEKYELDVVAKNNVSVGVFGSYLLSDLLVSVTSPNTNAHCGQFVYSSSNTSFITIQGDYFKTNDVTKDTDNVYITMLIRGTNTCKSYTTDVKVNITPVKLINNVSFTGTTGSNIDFGSTITAAVETDYQSIAFIYKWYYLDGNDDEVIVSQYSSATFANANYINKYIKLLVTPNIDEKYYTDVIEPISSLGYVDYPEQVYMNDYPMYLGLIQKHSYGFIETNEDISQIIYSNNSGYVSVTCASKFINFILYTSAQASQTYNMEVIIKTISNKYYYYYFDIFVVSETQCIEISKHAKGDINGTLVYLLTATLSQSTNVAYVPSFVEGYKVIRITQSSFTQLPILQSLYIPHGITIIENISFNKIYSDANAAYSIYIDCSSEEFNTNFARNYASWGYIDGNTTYSQDVYYKNSNGAYTKYGSFTNSKNIGCLVKGTLITLADGSKKNIEDITYNDLLLVKDLINGGYTYEYPSWIEKATDVTSYVSVKFDDGTCINMYQEHSLFDVDLMMYVDNNSLLQVGHRILKAYVDENGKVTNKIVTITSMDTVIENTSVYNIISASMFNVIADDCITSIMGELLLNNYTFNSDYSFNEEVRNEYMSNQDDLYTYEDLKPYLPLFVYYGCRSNETKLCVLSGKITQEDWFGFMILIIGNPNVYIAHNTNENGEKLFSVSTDNDINSQVLVTENGYYTLGNCTLTNNGKTFVGWRDGVTNIIYQAGDSVQIHCGTHFSAVWE